MKNIIVDYKIKFLFFALIIISFIYAVRISFTPRFASHQDNFWYMQIARNFALGNGLIDETVWFFAPRFDKIPHVMGDMLNPLGIIISGYVYRIFGFTDIVNKLQMSFMVILISVLVFIWCVKVYNDVWVSFFSSIIFAIHSFVIGNAVGGNIPETYHMFFNALFFYLSALAITKNNFYFLLAGIFGGLAYLVRNESIFCILVLIGIFFYKKYSLKEKVAWKYLFLSVGAFLVIILPWEIRNRILFGKETGWSKYHFFLSKEYYDMFAYSETPGLFDNIKNYLSLGPKMIVIRKMQSYFYNLNWGAALFGWIILIFVPVGLIKSLKMKEYAPVFFYMIITYLMMCFLNSVAQSGVWYGSYTTLAFIIPIAVFGIFEFGKLISKSEKNAFVIGLLMSIFVITYFLADNFKVYYKLKKNNFENLTEKYSMLVKDWFEKNNIKEPVVMTHFPMVINFFSGIKTVQIPSNDLDTVEKVAKKYGCNYLILYGDKPPVIAQIYSGEYKSSKYKLFYETKLQTGLPEDGGKIKIYKIDLGAKNGDI